MFHMKFSSVSHQICCIVLLYYSDEYMGIHKLVYYMVFCIFLCFYHCFYLEKCGLGKMLRFLIISCFLSSSHQNHFKFATAWIHCNIHYIMWLFSSSYILLFSVFWGVFTVFLYAHHLTDVLWYGAVRASVASSAILVGRI